MTSTERSAQTIAILRNLCQKPALEFGRIVLTRTRGDLISFRDFVRTAREMSERQPDMTAQWLAALIALEITRNEEQEEHSEPSRN